jgi:hypothetical protein
MESNIVLYSNIIDKIMKIFFMKETDTKTVIQFSTVCKKFRKCYNEVKYKLKNLNFFHKILSVKTNFDMANNTFIKIWAENSSSFSITYQITKVEKYITEYISTSENTFQKLSYEFFIIEKNKLLLRTYINKVSDLKSFFPETKVRFFFYISISEDKHLLNHYLKLENLEFDEVVTYLKQNNIDDGMTQTYGEYYFLKKTLNHLEILTIFANYGLIELFASVFYKHFVYQIFTSGHYDLFEKVLNYYKKKSNEHKLKKLVLFACKFFDIFDPEFLCVLISDNLEVWYEYILNLPILSEDNTTVDLLSSKEYLKDTEVQRFIEKNFKSHFLENVENKLSDQFDQEHYDQEIDYTGIEEDKLYNKILKRRNRK